MKDIKKFIISLALPQATGLLGALATTRGVSEWYVYLNKPALTPPSWIFGPVWTTLYILMGIALFLVWREGTKRADVRAALKIFAVQLVLNGIWSPLFFAAHNPEAALVVIVAMIVTIAWTIIRFRRISPVAAALLIPYLAWVSFASYLNAGVAYLN